MFNEKEIGNIQRKLLKWFSKNGRSFPWRQSEEPYHILVAEKLLQQTVARDHVVKAYKTIITQYPTIMDLAKANIKNIESVIHPLGLIYRAKEFLLLANEIVIKHYGEIPNELDELLTLHGIGDYSARAILSFAFNQDISIVDTNIARLIHRLFGLKEPISKNPARNKKIREFADKLIILGNSKKFNLALLDLCALICKDSSPKCTSCPLKNSCEYGRAIF